MKRAMRGRFKREGNYIHLWLIHVDVWQKPIKPVLLPGKPVLLPGNQYSCLENPMDGGAWWAAVHGVA